MSKPAARITDMHVCPMMTPAVPPIPHVGGPILPPGCPTVLIGGMPAARVGDMAVCVGPPDSIILGSSTVLIGNMPAARAGDSTAHGGTIMPGCPTVLIGDGGSGGGGGSPMSATMKLAKATAAPFATEGCGCSKAQPAEAAGPATVLAKAAAKAGSAFTERHCACKEDGSQPPLKLMQKPPPVPTYTLRVRLEIDPDEASSADDEFELFGLPPPRSRSVEFFPPVTKTVADDKLDGDEYVDLEFYGLFDGPLYTLKVSTQEDIPYTLFDGASLAELSDYLVLEEDESGDDENEDQGDEEEFGDAPADSSTASCDASEKSEVETDELEFEIETNKDDPFEEGDSVWLYSTAGAPYCARLDLARDVEHSDGVLTPKFERIPKAAKKLVILAKFANGEEQVLVKDAGLDEIKELSSGVEHEDPE